MDKASRRSPLEEFQENLWKLVLNYGKCSGVTAAEAVSQGMSILTGFLTEFAMGHKVPKIGKRTPEDQKTDDEDESLNQCFAISRGKISQKGVKKDAPMVLRQFIKRTECDFEAMMARIPLSGINTSGKIKVLQTNDPNEISMLGYHCFLASEVRHFPYTTEWVNGCAANSPQMLEPAYRILKAVHYSPPSATNQDKKILAMLNEKSRKTFELNEMTFSDGKYRGTPDAILKVKGVITSIAEFKASSRSEAENQLVVYLTLFNLTSGWIVLGCPSKADVIEVVLDPDMASNQAKRRQYYLNFIGALINNNKQW
jgi:hypothetical protein